MPLSTTLQQMAHTATPLERLLLEDALSRVEEAWNSINSGSTLPDQVRDAIERYAYVLIIDSFKGQPGADKKTRLVIGATENALKNMVRNMDDLPNMNIGRVVREKVVMAIHLMHYRSRDDEFPFMRQQWYRSILAVVMKDCHRAGVS